MNNKTVFDSLAFLFLVCLIFSSSTQGPIDVTNEIMEANKGFMEAFNSGDAKTLASFSQQLIIIPDPFPGERVPPEE